MADLVFLIIGFILGYFQWEIWTVIKIINAKFKPEPKIGATPGAYHKPNENNVNQEGKTGLVTPKTPQRLEWEEQERLREQQYK